MFDERQFYINGKWVDSHSNRTLDVVNPATTKPFATITLGDERDVDAAVAAARSAFTDFAETSRDERIALLEAVIHAYEQRSDELADVLRQEMGAPVQLCKNAQVPSGRGHLEAALRALKEFDFEERVGSTTVYHEPIGVCALITPWNWPLNQIAAKVAPALAAGCSMILKPSEIAPLSAMVFARVMEDAGVPAGVFNLVNGDGPVVGNALSSHPDVDMVSFTGSTRAGIEVARNAAATVKRVSQELGGKSANIVLDDADLETTIRRDVQAMYSNSGQSCNAGSRMLVPSALLNEVVTIARTATDEVIVGDPADPDTMVGPVVSAQQFDKVNDLIRSGIEEGATVIAGGPGRQEGLDTGYYVKPTVFSDVTPAMRIAREEIFGPVLVIMPYDTVDEAVAIANDSEYGLSGWSRPETTTAHVTWPDDYGREWFTSMAPRSTRTLPSEATSSRGTVESSGSSACTSSWR